MYIYIYIYMHYIHLCRHISLYISISLSLYIHIYIYTHNIIHVQTATSAAPPRKTSRAPWDWRTAPRPPTLHCSVLHCTGHTYDVHQTRYTMYTVMHCNALLYRNALYWTYYDILPPTASFQTKNLQSRSLSQANS